MSPAFDPEARNDDLATKCSAELLAREPGLARFLEAAPDAMAVIEAHSGILMTNHLLDVVFGYAPGELVGAPVEILMPERYREVHLQHRREYLTRPARRPMGAGMDLCCRRKDGSEFSAEISLSPMKTSEKPLVLVAVRDVTERKTLQTRLALSERLASVGHLAAGVAHEINNPLTAVTVNLDFIAAELGQSAQQAPFGNQRVLEELLAEAREGADRVMKIVRGLRLFSRRDRPTFERIHLPRILDVAINLTMADMRHRADLSQNVEPTPPVLADEPDLVQVFVNLLVNANQAIARGKGESGRREIHIATRTEDGRAVVEVSDTGIGIPPENIGRIFDPFFTAWPGGAGSGLGLAVCHGIVTALGGEISVTSTVGCGSTFRVNLPAAPPLPASENPADTPRCGPGRVLVVDEDMSVATALRRVLRNHDVTVAHSGREALALLSAGQSFDVILCDLMMPDMTGMELYGSLSDAGSPLRDRIVFMSGGAFTPEAQAFLARMSHRHLDKPWNPQSVRTLVESFLR